MASESLLSCILSILWFVLFVGYIGFTQFYPTGFTHWVKRTCQPCRHVCTYPDVISSNGVWLFIVEAVQIDRRSRTECA